MLYDKQDNYRGMYAPRTAEFIADGLTAGLRPVARDTRRVGCVIVDPQWDFVSPDGTLSVPGAQDDLARGVDWLYAHAEDVSSFYVSEDIHLPWQIFYTTWWSDDAGQHPPAWTMISLNGKGEAVDQNGRRMMPLVDPLWTLSTYLPDLKNKSQLDLMLWPYHCMEGTMGSAIMSALSEALAWHSAARHTQVTFISKGRNPRTEHYGILAAEVPDPKDPSTSLNTAILDALAKHDLIYVWGEAKSHCVLKTMKQMVGYFKAQPEVLKRIRFIEDCTSSVVAPGVDFEGMAVAALKQMEKQGVVIVKSTDPIG